VSRTVHPDEGFHDHAGTVMVVAWGQFMDHDYTLTATPLGELKLSNHSSLIHRQFAPQSISILTSLLYFIPMQYCIQSDMRHIKNLCGLLQYFCDHATRLIISRI
jgi:Animal haem peroxidase